MAFNIMELEDVLRKLSPLATLVSMLGELEIPNV
jgi:hypothetical protein